MRHLRSDGAKPEYEGSYVNSFLAGLEPLPRGLYVRHCVFERACCPAESACCTTDVRCHVPNSAQVNWGARDRSNLLQLFF